MSEYRFNLIHCSRGAPQPDSARMRFRIGRILTNYCNDHSDTEISSECGKFIEGEIGLEIPRNARTRRISRPPPDWERFTSEADIHDFLDAISLFVAFYKKVDKYKYIADIIPEIQRIFLECNVSYRIDPDGKIHPFIDNAFERLRVDTIRILETSSLLAAKEYLISAEENLLSSPVNWRDAIVQVFNAAENIFKQNYKTDRLSSRGVHNHIKQRLTDHTYKDAEDKYCETFSNWIDCAHHFRHETGSEVIHQPEDSLGISIVSSGFGYVRWLAMRTSGFS